MLRPQLFFNLQNRKNKADENEKIVLESAGNSLRVSAKECSIEPGNDRLQCGLISLWYTRLPETLGFDGDGETSPFLDK